MGARRRLGWAGVIAACLWSACGCAGPSPDPRFRVLTWNLLWSNTDHAAVAGQIRSSGADVVCLQEVVPEMAAALDGALAKEYPHRAFRPVVGSGEGYGLLSRHPIARQDHLPNPHGGPPAIRALVAAPAGPVQVLNVHLTYPAVMTGSLARRLASYGATSQIRLAEIRLFSRTLSRDVPTVVAGDFNSLEGEPCLAHLAGTVGLADAYRTLRPDITAKDNTWRPELGSPAPIARIDYVFASPALVPLEAAVLPIRVSDHCPVAVTFRQHPRP